MVSPPFGDNGYESSHVNNTEDRANHLFTKEVAAFLFIVPGSPATPKEGYFVDKNVFKSQLISKW